MFPKVDVIELLGSLGSEEMAEDERWKSRLHERAQIATGYQGVRDKLIMQKVGGRKDGTVGRTCARGRRRRRCR